MSEAASKAVFPAFVIALTAFAVLAPRFDLAAPLGLAPEAGIALLPLLAVVIFYPLIALLERIAPYRREWNEPHGDLAADALYFAVSSPFVSVAFGATLAGVAASGAAWIAERLGGTLWPASWPALAQLFLAILVAEFGHYWFHRVSHEQPLVWRLHATHHSAERLYWLNATRFHPIDLACLIAFQSVPLILLGAPPQTFLTYTLFATVYGQLQHANFEVRTRALDWIFSTPGLHRFHHATNSREGNTNYGAILITWDQVFGTFYRPRDRAFEGPVGIGKLPHFPRGWLAQLASPFRWRRVVEEGRAV